MIWEDIVSLDKEDKRLLWKKLGQRLGRMVFVCFVAALLPYVAVLAGMLYSQAVAEYSKFRGLDMKVRFVPTSWAEFKDFLIMTPVAGIIVYYGIAFYVVIHIFRKILPVLLDLIVRKKRVVVFEPTTYQLPGCADCFLQTPFRSELFAKVSREEYEFAQQGHPWQFQEASYSKVELFFAPVSDCEPAREVTGLQ